MELIFNPCGEFRWSPEDPVSQIHSPHLLAGATGISSVVVVLGLMTLLPSQVISVAFYSEHEKPNKVCTEALISAWGSFTCRKSTIRDSRLYFPTEGSHTQDFYSLKKIHRPRPDLNPRTSDPVAKYDNHGRDLSRIFKVCSDAEERVECGKQREATAPIYP